MCASGTLVDVLQVQLALGKPETCFARIVFRLTTEYNTKRYARVSVLSSLVQRNPATKITFCEPVVVVSHTMIRQVSMIYIGTEFVCELVSERNTWIAHVLITISIPIVIITNTNWYHYHHHHHHHDHTIVHSPRSTAPPHPRGSRRKIKHHSRWIEPDAFVGISQCSLRLSHLKPTLRTVRPQRRIRWVDLDGLGVVHRRLKILVDLELLVAKLFAVCRSRLGCRLYSNFCLVRLGSLQSCVCVCVCVCVCDQFQSRSSRNPTVIKYHHVSGCSPCDTTRLIIDDRVRRCEAYS